MWSDLSTWQTTYGPHQSNRYEKSLQLSLERPMLSQNVNTFIGAHFTPWSAIKKWPDLSTWQAIYGPHLPNPRKKFAASQESAIRPN